MSTLDSLRPIALIKARKILISGTFSSGKTTLCKAVQKALAVQHRRVVLVSEVPRRSPFALNEQQTILASWWLVAEQIRSEIEAVASENDLAIVDRGLPDIVSHSSMIPLGPMDSIQFEGLLQLARFWMRSFDLVFWARQDPSLAIVDDGFRVLDKSYQMALENSIESAFAQLGLKPRLLPHSLSDRVDTVLRELNCRP